MIKNDSKILIKSNNVFDIKDVFILMTECIRTKLNIKKDTENIKMFYGLKIFPNVEIQKFICFDKIIT